MPEARSYARYNLTALKNSVYTVDKSLLGTSPGLNSFYVEYNLPEGSSYSEVERRIPRFSGILNYTVDGSTVEIFIGNWNEGANTPPANWDGYFPNTFFPTYKGKRERVRILMKLFSLDPEVKKVWVENQFNFAVTQ